MKKLFILWMALLSFAVTACGRDTPEPEKPDTEQPGENEGEEKPTPGEDGRYLVLFCSRTGNTGAMAKEIKEVLDCDILEIVPATPYEDDYNTMLTRAQREQAAIEQGNYPEIGTTSVEVEQYDVIFVGYPIWYGHMATPMQTFLHTYGNKLAGKRIALFASSGSSGINTSVNEARNLCKEATFTETLHLTSATMVQMKSRVASWMEQLNVQNGGNNMESNKIKLTAGNKTLTATLADNSSAKALKELLAKGDISIDMRDYANMEKVGSLGTTLPRNDVQITTSAGDLILYQGNMFVIYYAPNTYSFTRLGKIDNTTREVLLSVLGNGDVTVTLSMN